MACAASGQIGLAPAGASLQTRRNAGRAPFWTVRSLKISPCRREMLIGSAATRRQVVASGWAGNAVGCTFSTVIPGQPNGSAVNDGGYARPAGRKLSSEAYEKYSNYVVT